MAFFLCLHFSTIFSDLLMSWSSFFVALFGATQSDFNFLLWKMKYVTMLGLENECLKWKLSSRLSSASEKSSVVHSSACFPVMLSSRASSWRASGSKLGLLTACSRTMISSGLFHEVSGGGTFPFQTAALVKGSCSTRKHPKLFKLRDGVAREPKTWWH